jgi:hypothetical protein
MQPGITRPDIQTQAPTGLLATQPGGEALTTALGTEFGPQAMQGLLAQMQPAGGMKPTSAMQNIAAATGALPGTPEFQQAMNDYMMKAQTQIDMGNKFITPQQAQQIRGPKNQMPPIGSTWESLAGQGYSFVSPQELKEQRERGETLGSIEQSFGTYKSMAKEYGAMPAWQAFTDPEKYNKFTAAYADLQLEIKELANLGVLAGPDMDLIERVVQDPTSIRSNLAQYYSGKNPLAGQLDIVEQKIEAAKKRAEEKYGKDWRKAARKPSANKAIGDMTDAELEAIIRGD